MPIHRFHFILLLLFFNRCSTFHALSPYLGGVPSSFFKKIQINIFLHILRVFWVCRNPYFYLRCYPVNSQFWFGRIDYPIQVVSTGRGKQQSVTYLEWRILCINVYKCPYNSSLGWSVLHFWLLNNYVDIIPIKHFEETASSASLWFFVHPRYFCLHGLLLP